MEMVKYEMEFFVCVDKLGLVVDAYVDELDAVFAERVVDVECLCVCVDKFCMFFR